MWKPFLALPAYLGGKRKLAHKILSLCPPPEKAPVFIDAFLGGGSVSLLAKALGYKVICNDIAERSYIIGKALIENNTQKITDEEIRKLFIPKEHKHFVEKTYAPQKLTPTHAKFLDNALANIEPDDYLLKLVIIKYINCTRPLGNFVGGTALNRSLAEKKFDDCNPKFLKTVKKSIRQHPYTHCNIIAKYINKGIINNSQQNEIHRKDVFEFLKNTKGNIVYFDPPYYGAMTYDRYYQVFDSILVQKVTKEEKSVFNSNEWLFFIDKLFQSAKHIPIWILSQ